MDSSDAKKLKQLEDENRKHLVAELTLDNRALKDGSQKTGSAYGTSGSRELRRGGVPDERRAHLQAAGTGTIDTSASSTERRAGCYPANAAQGTSRPAHAVRLD